MSDKQDASGYAQSEQRQQAEYGAYRQCTLTLGTKIIKIVVADKKISPLL